MINHLEDRVVRKNKVVQIIADKGYCPEIQGKVICKLTNTGNGFIAKFKSHTSSIQDNYVCLDYAEAEILHKALHVFFGEPQ